MKTIKILSLVLFAALFALSCSKDEDNKKSMPTPGSTYDLNITGDNDFDAKDFKGNIKANITLSKDTEYLMTGKVYVEEGFILTIEPGTKIKCKAGGTDVFLAVKRGAKIMAEGTKENPIVFTSAAENPRPGDWGGIVIAGKAKNNKGADVDAEVAGLRYGGTADDDNSGKMTYVMAKYTGAKINGDQEFNGITFYSVGSGTVLNNLMISHGDDDGVEFFGGTVNVENILCVNIKDDMFDFTDGFSGTLTNLFGVREKGFNDATEDPRGIEGDSNGSVNTAKPISKPTFDKLTILNLSEQQALKAGAEIRRGAVVTIKNAFFAAYGKASFGHLIDTEDDKGNGMLTIANSKKYGTVGTNKASGGITGSVDAAAEGDLTVAEGDDKIVTIKEGVGADFSKFAWTKYTLKL